MAEKHDPLHQRNNAGYGYWRTGFRGEYFGPNAMRMMSGEGSTMMNFIVFTVHLIYAVRVIKSRR